VAFNTGHCCHGRLDAIISAALCAVTRQILLSIGCGLCVSVAALGAVVYAGVPVSGMLGGLSVIVVLILAGPRRMGLTRGILCDLAPFAFMLTAMTFYCK
jgi:hypothetical protein